MKSDRVTIKPRDRLILALDFPTQAEALSLVKNLAGCVSFYKIGLQLYIAAGPDVVRAVAETGAKIFLDLKLHDIPNTVAKAVAAAGELGVQMLTVHLSGGSVMLNAAVAAKSPSLSLVGVTILTSATQETLRETGVPSPIQDQVLRLADLGKVAGLDGLITSPQEVRALRERLGNEIKLVTPGVRPTWAEANDQQRFTTPSEALKAGADYLVIGRPITAAPNPSEAVERLLGEIAG